MIMSMIDCGIPPAASNSSNVKIATSNIKLENCLSCWSVMTCTTEDMKLNNGSNCWSLTAVDDKSSG